MARTPYACYPVLVALVLLILGSVGAHADVIQLSATEGLTTWPEQTFRWKDIAGSLYAEAYRDTFTYEDHQVTVTFHPEGEDHFAGRLVAENLKPNFAYQIKLVGKPTGVWGVDGDDETNERIGYAGRWWERAPNPGNRDDAYYQAHSGEPGYIFEGYLLYDFLITDRNGDAVYTFLTDSSFHVLWRLDQRNPGGCDSPLHWHQVNGEASHPAYAAAVGPDDRAIFAEIERLCYGQTILPPGDYNCQILLTEESFHESGLGGYWAAAMVHEDLHFTLGVTSPVISQVVIENLTLSATDDFAKDGDDLRLSAQVSGDGLTASDIVADLSQLLAGGGSAVAAETFAGGIATWTAALEDVVLRPDGTGNLPVTATEADGDVGVGRDPDGMTADNTPPAAVTGLTAAPGHQQSDLAWNDVSGDEPHFAGYRVTARAWGSYPEYGSLPVPGSDPGYPEVPEEPGEFVTETIGTSFQHGVSARDIRNYALFAFDEARNYGAGVAGARARATNYWLGDVAPGGSEPGDGEVGTVDLSVLSMTYYLPLTDPDWDAHCDVGPTDSMQPDGIPQPDDRIDFEDLMIFALHYGQVGRGGFGPPVWLAPPTAGQVALSLRLPAQVEEGRDLIISLWLEDAASLAAGAHAEIAYDAEAFTLLAIEPGTHLAQGDARLLAAPAPGRVHASAVALGRSATLGGSGELARLRFRCRQAGAGGPTLAEGIVRDCLNQTLCATAGVERENTPARGAGYGPLSLRAPGLLHGEAWIELTLAQAGNVRLDVYDLAGRLVRDLHAGPLVAGGHRFCWDGCDRDGRTVPRGVYFYAARAPDGRAVRKVVLGQ